MVGDKGSISRRRLSLKSLQRLLAPILLLNLELNISFAFDLPTYDSLTLLLSLKISLHSRVGAST